MMVLFPREISITTPDGQMRRLADIEQDVLKIALDHYGSPAVAARHLGISRTTMYRRAIYPKKKAKKSPMVGD